MEICITGRGKLVLDLYVDQVSCLRGFLVDGGVILSWSAGLFYLSNNGESCVPYHAKGETVRVYRVGPYRDNGEINWQVEPCGDRSVTQPGHLGLNHGYLYNSVGMGEKLSWAYNLTSPSMCGCTQENKYLWRVKVTKVLLY